MKKKKILLLFISVMLFASTMRVNAAANLSVSASNVNPGQSFTATVNVSGAASWAIYVNATGPVSGCSINEANASDTGMNTTKSFSTTCTATGTGTITINLSGNTTDESSDFATPVSGSRTVTVTNPAPQPDPTPTPTPTPTPGPTPSVSPVTANDDRSSNADLSKISVENYSLKTDDNLHYTLSVPHSVSSVTIQATAADNKAKVSGTGVVNLKVGDNEFQVVVTAENGSTKTYYVKIHRKDTKYPFNDLKGALSDTDDVVVVINDKDVITANMLKEIQQSKKIMKFVRYDENNKVLYTWIVDGNKLDKIKDFNTGLTFTFDDIEAFDKESGYRKGVYLQFAEKNGFPKGISCEVGVADEFKNNDTVYLYSFDKNNKAIKLIEKAIKVQDGKVGFSIQDMSQYFLSKAVIGEGSAAVIATEGNNIYKVVAAVEFIGLFFFICLFVIMKNKKKPTPQQPEQAEVLTN